MRRTSGACHIIFVLYSLVYGLMLQAQSTSFHGAPASANDLTPPSIADSRESGKPLYERHCASCHGATGQGSGNIPSLTTATIKSASPGELVWFISKGDPNDGMPSWAQLPEKQRW
jgi:mono/diheme cytochrome c family protein